MPYVSPDFPNIALPEVPATWHDTTWRNDASPSFEVGNVRVWIDSESPAEREGDSRFIVAEASGDMATLWEGDSWDECLAQVLAYDFAARFAREVSPAELALVKERNAHCGAGICATHDVRDSNVTMDDSFCRVIARCCLAESSDDAALWSRAWDIAKACYLTAKGAA